MFFKRLGVHYLLRIKNLYKLSVSPTVFKCIRDMTSISEHEDPHTMVKRIMWKKYLQAFIAKTQQAKTSKSTGYNTVICDVFAGPGIIGDQWNEDIDSYGTPLIALRVAFDFFIAKNKLAHKFNQGTAGEYLSPSKDFIDDYRVKLFFNENDLEKYKKLRNNVDKMFRCYGIDALMFSDNDVDSKWKRLDKVIFGSNDTNISVCCHVTCGEFKEFKPPVLSEYDRMVTFIDPFELSQIPMAKVTEFSGKHKDLFINLMSSYMNNFFIQKIDVISNVFGFENSHLEKLHSKAEGDRIDFIVEIYAEQLKLRSSSTFPVLTFEMRNIQDDRLCHLLFMSTHIEGVKAMKESMNRGTQELDTFCFSDYKILRKNIPLNLRNQQKSEDVAESIFTSFQGKTVNIKEVENFIWLHTPFIFRKEPLAMLQNEGKIISVVDAETGENPQIKGTFPDKTKAGVASNWKITFSKKEE